MKQFLIIGNLNAVTYKEVFPLIKAGEVGLGVNGVKTFIMPSGTLQKFGNIYWYTTMTKDHINPPLTLTATYTPEAYPRYDNYDAIEVGRTKDIPRDGYGVMGVPISFLDKWNKEQFEIVDAENQPEFRGGRIYKRLIIRRIGACAQVPNLTESKRTDEY